MWRKAQPQSVATSSLERKKNIAVRAPESRKESAKTDRLPNSPAAHHIVKKTTPSL
jgi:hypothetical protein